MDTIKQRYDDRSKTSRLPRLDSLRRRSHHRDEEPMSSVSGTIFSPRLIVLALQDKRIPSQATAKLTHALRSTLMKACPKQPPPEWLSGHRLSGTPSTKPHLAFLSLPFVGRRCADGRIMGLAIAVPNQLHEHDVGPYLDVFLKDPNTGNPRKHSLFGNAFPKCTIVLETRETPPHNLVSDTWVRESKVWASATPVVLNRHYDGRNRWEHAAEDIKDACRHIGLPRPRDVLLHPVSLVEGAPNSRDFPLLEHKSSAGKRNHSHAVIIFDEPVKGPVLVGAGRFRGYGLCRPMDGGDPIGE